MEVVQTIYSADLLKRVLIYRLDQDSFSFCEEIWSDEPLEQCWIIGRWPRSVCDSPDTAVKEAKGRLEWL